jgi:guanine deaminase
MPLTKILFGQTLAFDGDPFSDGLDCAKHTTKGAVAISEGKIIAVGSQSDVKAQFPEAKITDYGDGLIIPGFVDTHVHYPQTAIVASWGKRLIDWLNAYTFPEEMRLSDPEYAAKTAGTFFDLTLSHGITTTASYCTIHKTSVDAFFSEAQARGLRAVAGKTCMDRNAPDGLVDTAQSGYDDSKEMLNKWHGVDRLHYAITPRFAPTSTPDQLRAMGALWAEYPDCVMQTHLSEQPEEIEWVKSLYPNARDYLDVYEKFGLIGKKAVMGHSIHLTDREIASMAASGTSVAHCPTSNTFIGSGLCDVAGLKEAGIATGLGTDTGGGSSFSMLRTMAAAYEVGQLRGRSLHAAHLIWLATTGGAGVLGLGDKIGTLAAGYDADLVVLDLKSTPAISQRVDNANGFWDSVFPTIMMGDDRAIKDVYAGGTSQVL